MARNTPLVDHELRHIRAMLNTYALMDIPTRHRVHEYCGARLDTLPVLAAVGGGTEDDGPEPELFPHAHREHDGNGADADGGGYAAPAEDLPAEPTRGRARARA